MSQILLEALAASLPLAALALLGAWSVERMGAGVKLRLCAWTAALLLPAAPAPAMLAIHALGIPSPFGALQTLLAPEPVVTLVEPAAGLEPAPPPEPPGPSAPNIPIAALLLGLAASGAAVRLGQLVLGLRRVARLRAASEEIADPELARRLGPGVRLADTASPLLAGLARPTILLPRGLLDRLSAEQAALICAHERAHLAAGDHLAHLMEETMVRLYWFNPFLAAARERLAAAREEACDARALAGCDAKGRRAYAHTLVAALRMAGPAEPAPALTGFRRQGAERRLKAILKPAGPGSWRAAAVAVLAGSGLLAVAGGLSLAAAAEPARPAAQAVSSDPLPPPPRSPSPSSPPGLAARPAPAAPPVPHHHFMVWREDENGHAHAHVDGHPVWLSGGEWNLDGDAFRDLTPEEKAKLKADLKRAQDEIAKAMAQSRAAMMGAHKELLETFHGLSAEDQASIHKHVEEAMRQAHLAMADARRFGPEDGRVPMRCKIGPDGKGTDCVPFPGPMTFGLFHEGPPAQQVPGASPAPPTPPAPPAVG